MGGGLGDIEEVLAAGRRLAAVGVPLHLYRAAGRPLPRSVDGPWRWPPLRRVDRPVRPDAPALTISAGFGIAAAPGRDEPLGRPGPWTEERARLEAAHGPDRVLHVSFEEFARTLTSAAQTRERWREGGVSAREIRLRARSRSFPGEVAAFHRAYRRFRAFDAPNVLHLFTGFRPSRAFAREFPEAVETGPLWPSVGRPRRPERPPATRRRPRSVLWYASPSTAGRLLPEVARGLSGLAGGVRVSLRSSHEWPLPSGSGVRFERLGPMAPAAWSRAWDRADLAIVTGSRTLLEAIERGLPFLYFNGVTGRGASARRHRPEKVASLLAAWRRGGAAPDVVRDLGRFARGQCVGAVVRRALAEDRWRARFPTARPVVGFRPPFEDAGWVVAEAARRLAADGPSASAARVVAALRAEGRPRRAGPGSKV